MLTGMARLTQCNQVAPVIGASFAQRQLVVDLFRLHKNPMFKTPLAEWMLRRILVSDPLPGTAVLPLGILISTILFILSVAQNRMLFAVHLPKRNQFTAARVFTWHFTFIRHNVLPSSHDKSHRRFLHDGSDKFLSYSHYNNIIRVDSHSITSTLIFINPSDFFQCLIVQTEGVLNTIAHIHRYLFPGLKAKIPQIYQCDARYQHHL